jgi:hypothetical protein
VIAVYGSFSLLQALLLTAGMGAAAAGLGGSLLRSKANDLAALKRKMLEDITVELEHIEGEYEEGERGAAYEKLGEELRTFRGLLDERLERSDSASIVADLHGLQRRIREEELDEKQCLARAEDATRKIAALRDRHIASWEKELTRLGAEMKRVPGTSASEHLGRLQGVMDELAEMDRLSSIASDQSANGLRETLYSSESAVSGPTNRPDGGPEDDARLCIRDIRDTADRIARMDPWESEKLSPLLEGLTADTPFPERLNLLRRQLRTLYGQLRERVVLTTLFREKLEELYALVQAAQVPGKDFAGEAAGLARRCETLCGGKYIDRSPFMALYEDICRFAFSRGEEIADALFAQKVGDVMDELGYELLTDAPEEEAEATDEIVPTLIPDRVQYLESPYEGYRVMIRTGERGEVSVRLVRAVADEKEKEATSEYQRRKDVETGQKWCHDVDGFLDRMREGGLPLDVTLRREPEESEVLVVVDRNLARRGARKKVKKHRPTLAEKLREREEA